VLWEHAGHNPTQQQETPMPHLLVITGASRGIGAALAAQAVASGHRVLGIARHGSTEGDSLSLDLSRPDLIEPALRAALRERIDSGIDGYTLVNNAATLDPIGSDFDANAASTHMSVNLVAAIVASHAFIRSLADVAAAKRIVNISSGAATRAIEGWSLYCASKAGLDHFGRCLALEQQRAVHPVDVVGVSPGVVDTDMQARIRNADPAQFPDLPVFQAMQQQGHLASPYAVAAKLLRGILGPVRFGGQVLPIDEFAASGG
jgi:benzil reductase ((S)-benzoin forming)